MFMSSSRNKFTLLCQNSVADVFVGFLPPCWCPSRWAPAWRLHTNLYKSGYNISLDISYTEYSSDLNLGEELGIFTSFHFPDSGLYLLNGFDCYFDLFWTAWHWEPAIANAHDYQEMSGTASELSLSFPTPCSRVSFRVSLARDFSHYPSISLKKRSSTRRVKVNLRRNCRVLFTTRQTRKHLIPAMLTVSNWIQSLPKRLIKTQEAH